ncbi:MAG: hypothetical protein RL026_1480 [Pseudomonadota bacterium]
MLYQLSYVSRRCRPFARYRYFGDPRDSATGGACLFRAPERVVGIEPTSSAWKAEVLPLNYTRQVPHSKPDARRSRRAPVGGGGRIRTYEGVSRQIYSLLPLAAWVPLQANEPRILGAGGLRVNAAWGKSCLILARTGRGAGAAAPQQPLPPSAGGPGPAEGRPEAGMAHGRGASGD